MIAALTILIRRNQALRLPPFLARSGVALQKANLKKWFKRKKMRTRKLKPNSFAAFQLVRTSARSILAKALR